MPAGDLKIIHLEMKKSMGFQLRGTTNDDKGKLHSLKGLSYKTKMCRRG
jgi:hypothetical protein